MISLGLHLSLKGGRESIARLAFTALGVAVGVALLLFTLSGFNGLKALDVREGWLLTSVENRIPSVDELMSDPLWWRLIGDTYGDEALIRVEVAATGPRSPLPPGIPRLPQAGEYYASPALERLLATTPRDVLGARFPAKQAGVIEEDGLTSPDALIAVVGRDAGALAETDGALQVHSIEAAPKEHDYTLFFRLVLGLGAVGLLVPVLVFVGTATRLAATRREERFAALRLVGATPRQVNVIASAEAALGAVIGTGVGFAAFWLFRPLVARIPFTGHPFFPSDLSLGWLAIGGVAVGVPVAAAVASLVALRRVRISPLGVTRHVTPKPPRPRRLIPAALGLGLLAGARILQDGETGMYAILAAFVIIIVGLMIAGPWLTMVGARLLAKFARRDFTLIAARRLSDDPGRAFRAISGLVLAVFVGSVFIGVIGTAIDRTGAFGTMTLPSGAVSQWLNAAQGPGVGSQVHEGFAVESQPEEGRLVGADAARLLGALRSLEGVDHVVAVYAAEKQFPEGDTKGLVASADLERLGVPGAAPAGAAAVSVPTDRLLFGQLESASELPAAPAPGVLAARPLQALVVVTDGRTSSVERARTALQVALPAQHPALSAAHLQAGGRHLVDILRHMVDVGIILSLAIAGCSLAVAVAGGLVERKRPFGLLRLTGMPLSHLRRVVVLEAAVPLALAVLVSAGAGLLAADLILRASPNGFGLSSPSASYYVIIGGGVAAALAIVTAALPLLDHVTRPESARME
jgi:hypothetical protein